MLGVGELDVFHRRDTAVLCEDDFNNGPSGWVPLMGSQLPGGLIMLDSEITDNRSRYSLFLQTGSGNQDGVNDVWGNSWAIKRMHRPQLAKKVYMDFKWAFGTEFDYSSPRQVVFAMDTCDANAVRNFFQVRWLNWDSGTNAAVGRYEVMHNGAWTPLPGPITYPHGFNENKRNLIRTEVVFDLNSACYDGLRINGIGYGSLAPTPDSSLRAFTPGSPTLHTFEGGLNAIFGVNNSNLTATTHSWANLAYQRTVVSA